MILVPLFSALLVAGTFIRFPLGAMPVTLQTMIIFLISLVLTKKEALLSTLVYLFLGLIGIPVFTTGGGIAAFMAPSGGFLIAMPFAATLGAFLSSFKRNSFLYNLMVVIAVDAVLYGVGIPFLKWRLSISWQSAFIAGFLPYQAGDIIKLVAAAISGKYLYKEVDKLRLKLVEKEST